MGVASTARARDEHQATRRWQEVASGITLIALLVLGKVAGIADGATYVLAVAGSGIVAPGRTASGSTLRSRLIRGAALGVAAAVLYVGAVWVT